MPAMAPTAQVVMHRAASESEIGWGDFQTMKYANASSRALTIKNGSLGTFHFVGSASFIVAILGKMRSECKQTCRFLLD
jgi:hypothetical protein